MYERMNIEDWKAKKKNDRDAVLADQKQALQEVLQDGTHLTAYLLGRGRLGSGITSGNAALVLKACPQATAVMSFDGWNQFGRRVSKGAVGISQLVRSGGYFTVGKVYDRSATYGNKPCPTVELQGDQLAVNFSGFVLCDYYIDGIMQLYRRIGGKRVHSIVDDEIQSCVGLTSNLLV